MSGRFSCAEGWRRHLHYGLAAAADDPLSVALPAALVEPNRRAESHVNRHEEPR
jgi:hypothetical protein